MIHVESAFWASAALAGGAAMSWGGFRALALRRLMQNTPTARIRSMSMGLVEVNGEAAARSELAAPFSGRPCAYWQVDVSTRSRRSGWMVVHRKASGNPFFLRDATGVALVYPEGATVRLDCQVEEECLGIALPEVYADYLKQQGPRAALWRGGALRFRERRLESGDHVYVLGTATPRPQAVAISMDGEEEELQATGTDAWRARRLHALDHEVQGVIRRGEHERTYVIAEQSERTLTLDLGLRAAGQLVGGPALALFGLGYWLYQLGAGHWPR